MQTPPESNALFAELLARAEILVELDGPQAEAWVSGLFPALDDDETMLGFVDYCGAHDSVVATLVCAAIAELTAGLDPPVSQQARRYLTGDDLPAIAQQIGGSRLTAGWTVRAPFGRSIVLGYENDVKTGEPGDSEPGPAKPDDSEPSPAKPGDSEPGDVELADYEQVDLQHSILVEIDEDGTVVDLQLAGPPKLLLDEAAASDDQVVVTKLDLGDALAQVAAAWPMGELTAADVGVGVAANQQFVRRRVFAASQQVLAPIRVSEPPIDIRRGLSDDEFAQANAASLSTLRAAVGDLAPSDSSFSTPELLTAWVGVIRGDGGELSGRERQGMLWLEWADWLGVGIGLLRGGVGSAMTGASFVDLVNRCPEVSSTIDKRDREYAEWAFDVAIDVLSDTAAADEGVLTEAGYQSLHGALVAAWTLSA